MSVFKKRKPFLISLFWVLVECDQWYMYSIIFEKEDENESTITILLVL
jgi:hypothetical protein